MGLSLCLWGRPLQRPQVSTASGRGLRVGDGLQKSCQVDSRETGLNSHESFTLLSPSAVSLGQESRHRCAGRCSVSPD